MKNDGVYLKLRLYRQSSLGKHAHPKLAPQFCGSIPGDIQGGASGISLSFTTRWGNSSSFSCVSVAEGRGNQPSYFPIPPSLSPDFSVAITMIVVLGLRQSLDGDNVSEVLIEWANSLLEDATWEQMEWIKSQFPDFHLVAPCRTLAGG